MQSPLNADFYAQPRDINLIGILQKIHNLVNTLLKTLPQLFPRSRHGYRTCI